MRLKEAVEGCLDGFGHDALAPVEAVQPVAMCQRPWRKLQGHNPDMDAIERDRKVPVGLEARRHHVQPVASILAVVKDRHARHMRRTAKSLSEFAIASALLHAVRAQHQACVSMTGQAPGISGIVAGLSASIGLIAFPPSSSGTAKSCGRACTIRRGLARPWQGLPTMRCPGTGSRTSG